MAVINKIKTTVRKILPESAQTKYGYTIGGMGKKVAMGVKIV